MIFEHHNNFKGTSTVNKVAEPWNFRFFFLRKLLLTFRPLCVSVANFTIFSRIVYHLKSRIMQTLIHSGVKAGGREQSAPWGFSLGNFCIPTRKRKGRQKVKMENKGRKTVNGQGRSLIMSRGPFFFFFTFRNNWNLFWVYQNGNFLPGKSISRQWEKFWKSRSAPSEKYSSYAPTRSYLSSCTFIHLKIVFNFNQFEEKWQSFITSLMNIMNYDITDI